MRTRQARTRRPSIGLVVAGITLATVAGACSAGVGDAGPVITRSPSTDGPSATPTAVPSQAPTPIPTDGTDGTPGPTTPPPTATPTGTTFVKVYLFLGDRLVAVGRTVPQTVAVGRASLTELIAGPTSTEAPLTSNVPGGTILLGLDIANGVATVDLSREFEAGGGSASMLGRLAQVVFTLTQFPTVDSVAFRIDGQPVSVFSGEGIVLNGPADRSDFEAFLPSIFLDGPAWNGTLANPAKVSGEANVFEATFLVEIRDAAGHSIARQQVLASCGTGCWGTFSATIPYSVASAQPGTVAVYDRSAKDGSVENLVTYPVMLTP